MGNSKLRSLRSSRVVSAMLRPGRAAVGRVVVITMILVGGLLAGCYAAGVPVDARHLLVGLLSIPMYGAWLWARFRFTPICATDSVIGPMDSPRRWDWYASFGLGENESCADARVLWLYRSTGHRAEIELPEDQELARRVLELVRSKLPEAEKPPAAPPSISVLPMPVLAKLLVLTVAWMVAGVGILVSHWRRGIAPDAMLVGMFLGPGTLSLLYPSVRLLPSLQKWTLVLMFNEMSVMLSVFIAGLIVFRM